MAALPIIRHTSDHRGSNQRGASGIERSTKLGDMSLSTRGNWSRMSGAKLLLLSVSVGVTVPVSGDMVDIFFDEIDITSGTVDPILSTRVGVMFTEQFSMGFRGFTRQIVSDNDGQQLGDYYAYTLDADYVTCWERLRTSAKILLIVRSQDKVNGAAYLSSGGEWLYVVPGATLRLFDLFSSPLFLRTEIELPLYRNVNGTQVVSGYNLRAGLSYSFSLFSSE